MSKYVCVKDCYYNGKRYAEGDPLEDGIKPNSYFRENAFREEAVDAGSVETLPVEMLMKKIENAEEKAADDLEQFKTLVGEHLAGFDERIKTLEAKLNRFVDNEGAKIPQGGDEINQKAPAVSEKQASTAKASGKKAE